MVDPASPVLLQFHILGPLDVIRNGVSCAPNAPLQRTLLALLLLHVNEVLPVSQIIDTLWGHRPPRSALAALQIYVSAVRRCLSSPDADSNPNPRRHPVLRTQHGGYLIRVEPDQLDLHRFRALASDGRHRLSTGHCAEAGQLFHAALGLWRGPALAGLTRSGVMERYAVRLEAERLSLLQERIGVDLCQGRALELIGELEELCAQHPLRESLHQQLMLALHLAGARAEALNVYQRVRRIMVDEAGIEPGPGLRGMQQAILTGSASPHLHPSVSGCRAPAGTARRNTPAGPVGRRNQARAADRNRMSWTVNWAG